MLKLAVVQMNPNLLDTPTNLARILDFLGEGAQHGAQLIVFPECALTGYGLTPQEAIDAAETIPGPSTEALAQACKTCGAIAQVGMLERGVGGQVYNSAALVGPQGVLAVYHKTHLPHLGVDRYAAPGGAIGPPARTALGALGQLICFDLRFPEPCRVLSLMGAQLVLVSTAWPASATLYADYLARTRAAESAIYIAAANRIGSERGMTYLGRSLIVGPDGRILAEAGREEETILYAEIDLTRSQRKRLVFVPGEYELDLFGARRPDLYGALVDPSLHQTS